MHQKIAYIFDSTHTETDTDTDHEKERKGKGYTISEKPQSKDKKVSIILKSTQKSILTNIKRKKEQGFFPPKSLEYLDPHSKTGVRRDRGSNLCIPLLLFKLVLAVMVEVV